MIRLLNKIIFLIYLFRKNYHEVLLSLLVLRKNSASNKNWLIMLNSENNFEANIALMAISRKYSKKKWHIKFVFSNNTFFKYFRIKDDISSALKLFNRNEGRLEYFKDIKFEWNINFDKREAIYDNINYFEIIDSSICNFNKSYKIDIESENYKKKFFQLIKSSTYIICLCRDIQKNIIQKNISIIMLDADRFPNAILLEYFYKKNLINKLSFYSLGKSYSIYNDKGNWHTNKFMLTKSNPLYANHYFAWKNDFHKWFKNKDVDESSLGNFFTKIYDSKHYISNNFDYKNKMKKKIKKIIENKKNHAKVYCLFAHLFFDRPIIDNTNLFNGMPDWVSKIIDIFNESDHILLIKPHVAETFYPESKKPQQTLINFLKSKTMSENIIILEPDLFLSSEITKIIDASIIWRSTAFVENIALKIPSIFCGPHSAYTNVLETKNFKNINEFKKELFNIVNNKITDAESVKAKALLYYLNVIAVHEVDIQSSMGKIFNNNTFINPFKLIKYIFNEKYKLNEIKL